MLADKSRLIDVVNESDLWGGFHGIMDGEFPLNLLL